MTLPSSTEKDSFTSPFFTAPSTTHTLTQERPQPRGHLLREGGALRESRQNRQDSRSSAGKGGEGDAPRTPAPAIDAEPDPVFDPGDGMAPELQLRQCAGRLGQLEFELGGAVDPEHRDVALVVVTQT